MLTARILLAPHVSTLLMDQHRGHHTEMLEAYAAAARELEAERPAAIVALTARWEAPGPFLADAGRRHTTLTDYYGFGVEVRYDCHGAPALARALVESARAAGVRAATTTRGVDSGVFRDVVRMLRLPHVGRCSLGEFYAIRSRRQLCPIFEYDTGRDRVQRGSDRERYRGCRLSS